MRIGERFDHDQNAEGKFPEPRRAPRVVQFSLKALLLLQLYVAVGLGLICWFGRPIVPSVFGVFGAMIGYGATLFLGRRRVFDVIVVYLVGIMIASWVAAFHHSGFLTLQEETLNQRLQEWTILAMPVVLPLVAVVAKWRLQRWDRPE